MVFYPLNRRVVLFTNNNQSSVPIETMKNCSHLFNNEFAREICPLLGLDQNVSSLLNGIHKLYLGRCIIGLSKWTIDTYRRKIPYERELTRIVNLIKIPGSDYYTAPTP